jgi:hypothetical protein
VDHCEDRVKKSQCTYGRFILAAVSHKINAGDERIISCIKEIWDRRFDPGRERDTAELEKWLGQMIRWNGFQCSNLYRVFFEGVSRGWIC